MMQIFGVLAMLLSLGYQQNTDLIFVQQVFRHGSRYPIYPNPLDGSDFA